MTDAARKRGRPAPAKDLLSYFSCPKKPKLSLEDTDAMTGASNDRADEDTIDETSAVESTHCALHTTPVHFCKPELGLNVDYYHQVFSKKDADKFFLLLETQLAQYLEQSENKVHVFGKTHSIPRKQAAFGDSGLSYSFSGVTVSAHPWLPLLLTLKHSVEELVKETFNFVLINRYGNGSDHIGEHRDDERDLVPGAPIAGLSFGQSRDFVFKHKDSRGKSGKRKDISPVKIHLGHGSLVVMRHPTNTDWYHSVPPRKGSAGVRISLTFRRVKAVTA